LPHPYPSAGIPRVFTLRTGLIFVNSAGTASNVRNTFRIIWSPFILRKDAGSIMNIKGKKVGGSGDLHKKQEKEKKLLILKKQPFLQ
jgi:hypothetical protein